MFHIRFYSLKCAIARSHARCSGAAQNHKMSGTFGPTSVKAVCSHARQVKSETHKDIRSPLRGMEPPCGMGIAE